MEQLSSLERYSRQVLLPEIGAEGQERLRRSRAVVIGVGALGTHLASTLVRAGVGFVRLVDRDYIEENNLQRQVLFDEADIAANLPKAVAAAGKLRRANSQVIVEPVVADVDRSNVLRLIQDCDLVLDGADNFEVRLLVNDACIKLGRPWIYGAAIATYGMTMTILPGETPCLRCLLKQLPMPGTVPTCDTAGVLGTAPQVIAGLEATEALKILSGRPDLLHRRLLYVDVWAGTMERLPTAKGPPPCPACDEKRFEFLQGRRGTAATTLCGRQTIQINVHGPAAPDFATLAGKLSSLGEVSYNEHMLRFRSGPYEIVLFPDGRALVNGTTEEGVARSLYTRYIGL